MQLTCIATVWKLQLSRTHWLNFNNSMFLVFQEKFNANLYRVFFYSLPKKDSILAQLLVRLIHLPCAAGSYTTLYIPPVDILAWKAGIIFVIMWFYNGFSQPCTSTTLVRADVWLLFDSWLSCKLSVRWYNVMFICSIEVVILREHNNFNSDEAETSCRSNCNWKLHQFARVFLWN